MVSEELRTAWNLVKNSERFKTQSYRMRLRAKKEEKRKESPDHVFQLQYSTSTKKLLCTHHHQKVIVYTACHHDVKRSLMHSLLNLPFLKLWCWSKRVPERISVSNPGFKFIPELPADISLRNSMKVLNKMAVISRHFW